MPRLGRKARTTEWPARSFAVGDRGARRRAHRDGGAAPVLAQLPVFAQLAALFFVALVATSPIGTNDAWIHLTTGRIVLSEHRVPRTDPYSFAARGRPYVAHEWLAATLYALAEHAGGQPGVVIVAKVLPALAAAGALIAAFAAAGVPRAIAAGLFPLALLLLHRRILARPDLIALALFASLLALLLRERRAARRGQPLRWGSLAAAFAITAIWANVHGSFFLAPALVAAWIAAELTEHGLAARGRGASLLRASLTALGAVVVLVSLRWGEPAWGMPVAILALVGVALVLVEAGTLAVAAPRASLAGSSISRWGALVAGVTLAPLASPWGPDIYRIPFRFNQAVTQGIYEWQPLLASSGIGISLRLPLFLALLALWLAAVANAIRSRRLRLFEFGLAAALLALAFRQVRWTALAGVGSTPLIGTLLGTRVDSESAASPATRRLVLTFDVAAVLLLAAAAVVLARARPDLALRATAAAGILPAALAVAASRCERIPPAAVAGLGVLSLAGLSGLALTHGIPEFAGSPLRADPFFRERGPVGRLAHEKAAVDFLASHELCGRLYTEYDWAAYVIYRLWPRCTVFVDSRSDVYGPRLLHLYSASQTDPALARRLLERYEVEFVLVPYPAYPAPVAVASGVLRAVEKDRRWALVFLDDRAALYARRSLPQLPPPLDGIEPTALRPPELGRDDPRLERSLERALARAPGSALLRYALAWRLREQGKTARAAALIEEAWRLNPRLPAVAVLAGDLARDRGRMAEARRWYERALRLAPKWPLPRSRLEAVQP